ncbi:MAG: hypothetical protein L6R19_12925 [Alphaproteobacteria bacterium]|nr:hypothetical protein [Alphaproteobacteria bacterium]
MPRQNRVTPFGEIVALKQRGRWMGNRGGCLQDDAGRLGTARWRTRAWLICRLEFKGWYRKVMQPGLYTELFFFDEATALAAGHRPCALCRRADYDRFRDAVAAEFGGRRPSAAAMDLRLHADRLDGRAQRRTPARLGDLPDGAMVLRPGAHDPWLKWQGALRRWTQDGYDRSIALDPRETVAVLTPALTLAALRGGFRPQVGP